MSTSDIKALKRERDAALNLALNRVIAYYPYPATLDEIPLDGHAVIEASAGTGKTYTIEHLVVDRLMKTRARLEQLLVVTFTDKATSELRKRIRELIERILKTSEERARLRELAPDEHPALPDEPPPNHWAITINIQRKLERALFSFERASIYTIHAFCRKVLVDLAFDSGQLFEQELIDGRRAFRDAWRRSLRYLIAEHAEFRDALTLWLTRERDLKRLEQLLYEAYSLGYLELQRPFQHEAVEVMERLIKAWDADALREAFEQSAIISKALTSAREVIEQLDLLFAQKLGVEDTRTRLVEFELDRLTKPHRSSSKKKLRFPDALPLEVRDILTLITQLKILSEMEGALERKVVDALLPEVNRDLTKLKRRAGLLDYDDLMRCVWRALCSPQGPNLSQTLRDRFRYALIDEFQDTDPLQWKIFRRVFVDAESPRHALYIIGDPKQAIYTFRGADVHTYIQARYELVRTGAPRVPLKMNYRSSPALIDAVNMILDQSGEQPLFQGPIQYTEPVESGLTALQLTDQMGKEVPPVTLWRFRPPPPTRGRATLSSGQLKRAFSHQLSQQIHALLYDEASRLYIERDGERRPITPNDILILVRENREAVEVGRALREVEVPFTLYKPEGLLQGVEAREIYHLLKAIVDPHDRGARLRAFTTPFFGVAWSEVYLYSTLPPGDARLERLLNWHQLALEGKYSALFYQVVHQSGLSERELFFAESERELTNYLHIFEILLTLTSRDPMTPAELCEQLGRMRAGIEAPPESEDNIQRLYSDRQMVQVMTIHKSKGLEAPVIILYGGFGRPQERQVNVIQDPKEGRRVLVGAVARRAVADRLLLEQRQEDQRLLYVALTRPQVKLYLPLIDSSRAVQGSYHPLKERLYALAKKIDKRANKRADKGADPQMSEVEESMSDQEARWRALFEIREVSGDVTHSIISTGQSLTHWEPPKPLLEIPDDRPLMMEIRSRHRPLMMTSYTQLKAQGGSALNVDTTEPSALDDEVAYDPSVDEATAPRDDDEQLPGGRHMGRCLHEIIEELPFGRFPHHQEGYVSAPLRGGRGEKGGRDREGRESALPSYEAWITDPVICATFESVMRRHGIELRWLPKCQRLIYGVLNRPIPLPQMIDGSRILPPLSRTRYLIEMEFLFPIPERAHPTLVESRSRLSRTPIGERALLSSADERLPWRVERGFVKGFIDFIFEIEGRVYFADWKSDVLLTYSGSDFRHHIEDHYLLQAQLYTLGVVRWLRIDDEESYERRFGGLFYFFLRAFAHENNRGEGVYFSRPSWDEVCEYERELGALISQQLAPRESRGSG